MQPTQLFLSWSGATSRQVASLLQRWLPEVLPWATAWMSAGDIEAGVRWSEELVEQLNKSSFGILCLTHDNRDAPWVLFEAGALARTAGVDRIVPYLFHLGPTDVRYPLAMFQGATATREGTFELVKSVNKAGQLGVPADWLDRSFHRMWPELERGLASVGRPPECPGEARPDRELLEEVLALTRESSRRDSRYPFLLPVGRQYVTVDLQPFLPEQAEPILMEYQPDLTVSCFIDRVYYAINELGSVPAYRYGSVWVLRDEASGKRYDDLGVEYCDTRGQIRDDRPVSSVGIRAGDRLAVIPCEAGGASTPDARPEPGG